MVLAFFRLSVGFNFDRGGTFRNFFQRERQYRFFFVITYILYFRINDVFSEWMDLANSKAR